MMNHLLKSAMLAAQMEQMRADLKKIHGSAYLDVTATARELVRGLAERNDISFIEAARQVANMAAKDGHIEVVPSLVSAALDLTEERL